MEFVVSKQEWQGYIRYIIRNGYGSIMIDIDDKRAFIWSLYIDEISRKQGYGTKILKFAELIVKGTGHDVVYLEYDKKTTPKFVFDWYNKLGYKEKSVIKQKMLMMKKLV